MKRWKRQWKIELIEKMNPDWDDLYYEYGGEDIDEALKDYKINNNEKS